MSRTGHPITGLFADHLREQPESYLWLNRSSFGCLPAALRSIATPDFSAYTPREYHGESYEL